MDFKEIAAISGKNGLFKILKPTRNGVILESIEASPKKLIANSNNKISILQEISVYTTGEQENLPLGEIFYRIYEKYALQLPVDPKAHPEDLKNFLGTVVGDFDRERVYPSDIKKIVTWYQVLAQSSADILVRKSETEESSAAAATEQPTAEVVEEKTEKPAKAKKAKSAEPVAAETEAEPAKKPAKAKKAKEA